MIWSPSGVVFATAIILFSVDVSISQAANFLIEQNTSIFGIALYAILIGIFITASIFLIRLVKKTTTEIRPNSKCLSAAHAIALTAQISLAVILIVSLAEILLLSEYHSVLLILATGIGYLSAASIMLISTLTLVGWYSIAKDSYVVLIFGAAFATIVYIYLYLGVIGMLTPEDRLTITPSSEVLYSTDGYVRGSIQEILSHIYQYVATGSFVLIVAGSAVMLRHYSRKFGRVRFWMLVLLPLAYFISTLIDVLGIYIPKSDAELFNYYVYVSLNGIIGGMLLGFAFWSISRTIRPNESVATYIQLCAYGFIFLSLAEASGIVASYPPFGLTSFSMLPISSYLIILGLYSTSISISQDVRLRQYIKDLTEDSGFLSTIGRAQLERKVREKAADLENVVIEQEQN